MSSPVSNLVDELMPIHEAMARFERGGPSCSAMIERIYERLRELEDKNHRIEDLEERLELFEGALEEAIRRLEKAGLLKDEDELAEAAVLLLAGLRP